MSQWAACRCGSMGYRGRVGLYEVMVMSEEIRTLTLERASADQITAVAVREGMRRLRDDGLEKVKAGLDVHGRDLSRNRITLNCR